MTAKNVGELLQAEAELVSSGLDLQAQALTLLLTEMRALSEALPGAAHIAPTRSDTEAEIETDFDNMPV